MSKNSSLEGLIWQAIQLYPIETLKQFVVDPDERVRLAAARRLQVDGGEIGYALALELLNSNDLNLKILGVFILGQLGAPDFPFADPSFAILLHALNGRSKTMRREAIVALGHLGVDAAIPELLKFSNSKDEKTRIALASSLARFDGSRLAKSALRKMKSDGSANVRYWAS